MIGDPPILRPMPQRSFQNTPASTEPSTPPTPSQDPADHFVPKSNAVNPLDRTRSVLNLTSSTLLGIYSGENDGLRNGITTPMGSGAMTPQTPSASSFRSGERGKDLRPPAIEAFGRSPRHKMQPSHHPSYHNTIIAILPRTILLFVYGMAYGIIVTHLHNDHQLAPVKVGGIEGNSWNYLCFWGTAGIIWGTLLPLVDVFWGKASRNRESEGTTIQNNEISGPSTGNNDDEGKLSMFGSNLGADWNPIVRSIGAFIGIAFAIRKLPWQSTLQVSLTLALVNPVLWYIIDRSRPGFILSTVVGIFGTGILIFVNPDMVPPPAILSASAVNVTSDSDPLARFVSHETIGVWTWVASVLFCSCVCFGNIGRWLALNKSTKSGSIS